MTQNPVIEYGFSGIINKKIIYRKIVNDSLNFSFNRVLSVSAKCLVEITGPIKKEVAMHNDKMYNSKIIFKYMEGSTLIERAKNT